MLPESSTSLGCGVVFKVRTATVAVTPEVGVRFHTGRTDVPNPND